VVDGEVVCLVHGRRFELLEMSEGGASTLTATPRPGRSLT